MSPQVEAMELNTKKLLDLVSAIVSENARLHAENKKLRDQLDDSSDGIRERDLMIADLQQQLLRK
jgi:regulator of replication initiation timing